jgi:hypothetical protein
MATEEEAGIEATDEEIGSSGVQGDRETNGVESGMDLENFEMKSETTREGLLFIDSKISAAVLN